MQKLSDSECAELQALTVKLSGIHAELSELRLRDHVNGKLYEDSLQVSAAITSFKVTASDTLSQP